MLRSGLCPGICSLRARPWSRRTPRIGWSPSATATGVTISSVSAPQIQAQMLEQAALGAGMRVLEIGSGGYNAALMAEIVGPAGEVTTLDIDRAVAERARRCLRDAGYERVEVVVADGEDGCSQRAPFDRIVVTAGAWDIPPAWVDQLVPGEGIITVPLRMRGLTRSLALATTNGHLTARSARLCGFVDMQGAGKHREHALWTGGKQIRLRFDDGRPPEPSLLDAAFSAGRAVAWSGVMIARTEPFDSLQLWLATVLDGFCLATVDQELDSTLTRPANRIVSPAVVDGQSFGYLAVREADDTTMEFGAAAFGPEARVLAEVMTGQVREWDQTQRGGPGPRIAVYPAHTASSLLPSGLIIDKRHVRITISWPTAGLAVPRDHAQ